MLRVNQVMGKRKSNSCHLLITFREYTSCQDGSSKSGSWQIPEAISDVWQRRMEDASVKSKRGKKEVEVEKCKVCVGRRQRNRSG